MVLSSWFVGGRQRSNAPAGGEAREFGIRRSCSGGTGFANQRSPYFSVIPSRSVGAHSVLLGDTPLRRCRV